MDAAQSQLVKFDQAAQMTFSNKHFSPRACGSGVN
jgi:hypothetical protein